VAKRPAPNWKQLREQLWIRCNGYCEVSGIPLDFETFDAHHRRPKQMGGTYRLDTDTLVNLIALDPIVHNGSRNSVHQAPGWSRPRGYLLHGNSQPVNQPLLLSGARWVRLRDDAAYERVDNVEAAELNDALTAVDLMTRLGPR
jgi:hypothetical protein